MKLLKMISAGALSIVAISSAAYANQNKPVVRCSYISSYEIQNTEIFNEFSMQKNTTSSPAKAHASFDVPVEIISGELYISAQKIALDKNNISHVIDVKSIRATGGYELQLSVWKHTGNESLGESPAAGGPLATGRTVFLNTGSEDISCTLTDK